jgi:hypothetical protein
VVFRSEWGKNWQWFQVRVLKNSTVRWLTVKFIEEFYAVCFGLSFAEEHGREI